MLILLLENPSDDSVEMAVDFCKEVRHTDCSLLWGIGEPVLLQELPRCGPEGGGLYLAYWLLLVLSACFDLCV